MKRLLLLLLCSLSLAAYAQEDSEPAWRFSWHGFVNPVLYGDTRQVVAGREDMMLFYPKPVALDSVGTDTNAEPSLNMLSITARLNLTIMGPDVLGAKMKGFIEGDFSGATDATINMFRLRHAYIDMKWQHNRLLMGQYWYPMVVEEIMPGTQPLNMGAPFHPYARYNQIRDYYRLGNWEVMGAALFQLDNKSKGPEGGSTVYLKRGLLPEMSLQLRYVGNRLFAGVAANYLRIVPRAGYAMAHTSYSFFAKYLWNEWALKMQLFPNTNLYESCMMGGYAEYQYRDDNEEQTYGYQARTYSTVWLDFGKTTGAWRPGIFVGYAANNGNQSLEDTFYGKGSNEIASLWRVQPRIAYMAGHGLNFAFEIEHTVAQYYAPYEVGCMIFTHDPNNKPANTRFILSACYAF